MYGKQTNTFDGSSSSDFLGLFVTISIPVVFYPFSFNTCFICCSSSFRSTVSLIMIYSALYGGEK